MQPTMCMYYACMDIAHRRRLLPLSLAYRPQPGRPHALEAAYPARWWTVRDRYMGWHRWGREDWWRGRCEHCGIPEWELRRGRGSLQCAHLYHNPDRLDRGLLAALCPRCHRAHDTVHREAASALTLWLEGRVSPAHLRSCRTAIRQACADDGLVGLTPGGADLTVALLLRDAGPRALADLGQQLKANLPGVGAETPEDIGLVVAAALARLRLRRLPLGGSWKRPGPSLLDEYQGLYRVRQPSADDRLRRAWGRS